MRRTHGGAMIEFAISAPLLMLLSAGVLNYSLALRSAIAVSDAARAGAGYGCMSPANAGDLAGIRAAAADAAPNLSGLTVDAAPVCKCANGSAVSCSGSCASGPLEMYVEVTARSTSPNVFGYPGLPFTGAIRARAVMRAR